MKRPLKAGTDSIGRQVRITDPYERVMARTERVGECLVWTGPLTFWGYCHITLPGNKAARGHRIVWRRHHPDEPMPPVVMHTCDNRACVEPTHLVAGTASANNADMREKGRLVVPTGERHGNARLTDAQIRAIRARGAEGATERQIAQEFGCNRGHVYKILRYQVRKAA